MNEITWSDKDLREALESHNDVYYHAIEAKVEEHSFSQTFLKHMRKLIRQSFYSKFKFIFFVKTAPLCRRAAAAIAATCLCVFMGVPALAANVPTIYNLMYLVSPATAQFFMPVRKACEDNGIRMEVVSTYIHDDTAEIYVTLQDLAGGRVDETTDLFDSYDINRPFDSAGFCQRVGYDEATKTATFLIEITEWGNRRIEGDKITFSVGSFISEKRAYEDMPLDIPLDTVIADAPTKAAGDIVGGGGNFDFDANDTAKVLDAEGVALSPVDGIDIVGIGFVDGKLHIQTSIVQDFKSDNHGYLTLVDNQGAMVESDYTVSFISEVLSDETGARLDNTEYVFPVSQDEIQKYKLYGSFYTSGKYTEGNWRITFPLLTGENAERKGF
jgi:hypothetical protein